METIGKIKQMITDGVLTQEDAEKYFPELKEGEDEKIRKWIINEIKIKHHNLDKDNVDFVDKAIAYLEKQGQTFTKKDVDDAYLEGMCAAKHELEKQGEQKPQGKTALEAIKEEKIDNANKVEQKSAWSEEDESHIRYLIECLEHCKKGVSLTMTASTAQEYINWLKNIKERVQPKTTWKPSDEQIEALESATENCAYSEYQDCLRELIEQLKKLKG